MAVDYNWVAHFVRVVRAGSFTAAARSVGLPTSALSRTVSNLERVLGVRLLHRTTRKLALTDAGQAYFDAVGAVFATLDDATERVLDNDTAPRGIVRIALPSDSPELAQVLAGFMRAHPGICLEARVAARYVSLVDEHIDLAIRVGALEDSSLIARKLGVVESGLFASAAYLERRGRPKTVDDLRTHDWILYRPHGRQGALALSGPGGSRTLDVEGALTADDLGFCRAACEGGAGIARLATVMAGELERVLPAWSAGETPISLVMPAARLVPRRVALLHAYLVEHVTPALRQGRRARARTPRANRSR